MAEVHTLKTQRQFFHAIERGEKRFEVRLNDRNFQRGDTVVLKCFDPVSRTYDTVDGERYKAKSLTFAVGYVLNGPAFGIASGYCVFALEPVDDATTSASGKAEEGSR